MPIELSVKTEEGGDGFDVQPGVNWGRGRLRKHESFYALIAKFAILNGLSTKRAWRFLKEKLGLSHQGDFLEADDQVTELARLLDESQDLVLTLRCCPHDLSRWTGPIFDGSGLGPPLLGIRYCRKCITEGYHAFFHQFRYVSFCPIHKVELQSERSGLYGFGDTRFERNCRLMADIFRRYNPSWPEAPRRDDCNFSDFDAHPGIETYIFWSKETCRRLADIGKRKLWSSVGKIPSGLRSADGTIGSLAAVAAYFGAPKDVAALLPSMPAMIVIKRTYPNSIAEVIESVFSDESVLHTVLDVYRMWWAWSKGATYLGEQLMDLLDRLRADHVICDCRWHWTDSRGWKCRTVGTRKRFRQECANDLLRRCIGGRWGELSCVPEKYTMVDLECYAHYLQRLEVRGLVEVSRRGNERECLHDPLKNVHLTWRLPQQVMELVQTLLLTELEINVEVWMNWLDWMNRNEDPSEYNGVPQYSALLRVDEGFELVRWKEGRSKYEHLADRLFLSRSVDAS